MSKFFLCLLLLYACTQSGTVTQDKAEPGSFSCLLGQAPFRATFTGATIERELSDGTLQLIGMDEKNQIAVEILLDNVLAQAGKTVAAEGGVGYLNSGKSFTILPTQAGSVTITARSGNSVKGTFYFTAYEDAIPSGKNIVVKEGKFDLLIEQ